MLQKGKIVTFDGTLGSGISSLVLMDDSGNLCRVQCDVSATARALVSCFPEIKMIGNRINEQALIGQEIFWRADITNTSLLGFVPIADASGEVWEQYLSGCTFAEV